MPTRLAALARPTTFARDARTLIDGGYKLVSVTPVDSSNSVVLRGDPAAVARVRPLVEDLDRRARSADDIKVIFLEHANAEQLLPVLQQIVGQPITPAQANATPAAGAEGAAGARAPPLAATAAGAGDGLPGLPRRPGPVRHGPAEGRRQLHRQRRRRLGQLGVAHRQRVPAAIRARMSRCLLEPAMTVDTPASVPGPLLDVAELAKRATGKTIYILDEPSTGLHFEDILLLLKVLQRLVDEGNTVLVIEHNLDMIKTADYIIDIGPEGGQRGGQVLFEGTPQQMVKKAQKVSYTAKYLAQELKKR